MGKQPSAYVLEQMFGEDTPIGAFAEERHKENLARCKTVNDYVKAICDYAKDLHHEQASYEDISPFGGLDIDVESIEVIAETEASKVHSNFIKDISLEDFEDKIYIELLKRGNEICWMNDMITLYTAYQKIAEQADAMYENYQRERACVEKQYEDEIDHVYVELDRKIKELKEKSNKNVLSKLFRKKRENIASQIEELRNNAEIEALEIKWKYDEIIELPPGAFICSQYFQNIDVAFGSKNSVESFKKEAAEFIEQYTDLYKRCCRLLQAAGKKVC